MNKIELLEKLEAITYRGNWDDGMGSTGVSEFITLTDTIKNDEDIMAALWDAVSNRNRSGLESAAEEIDGETLPDGDTPESIVWLQWTNSEIEFDYSDIQAAIDAYRED